MGVLEIEAMRDDGKVCASGSTAVSDEHSVIVGLEFERIIVNCTIFIYYSQGGTSIHKQNIKIRKT